MNRLLILPVVLLSLLVGTPAWGEWTKVSTNVDGITYSVDFDRIKHHVGHVYYWELHDLIKPVLGRFFLQKIYKQVECNLFRFKILSLLYYEEPMGRGSSLSDNSFDENWRYPPPTSSAESILKSVCNYVKNR